MNKKFEFILKLEKLSKPQGEESLLKKGLKPPNM